MNFVCEHCKAEPHDFRPKECPGGTRCDCRHRQPKQ